MNLNIENFACEPLKNNELLEFNGGGWLKNIFHDIGYAVGEWSNRFEPNFSALEGGNQDRY